MRLNIVNNGKTLEIEAVTPEEGFQLGALYGSLWDSGRIDSVVGGRLLIDVNAKLLPDGIPE